MSHWIRSEGIQGSHFSYVFSRTFQGQLRFSRTIICGKGCFGGGGETVLKA